MFTTGSDPRPTTYPSPSTGVRPLRFCGIAGITAALLAGAALATPYAPAFVMAAYGEEATVQQTDPSATPVYAPDAVPAGCVTIGVTGTYTAVDDQAVLDRINQIRAEAAAEGISVGGAAVSGAPLQWSTGLAYVAQIRAAENSLLPLADCVWTVRPNGTSVTSADANNPLVSFSIAGEAAGSAADTLACVESWYAEKQTYLDYLATGTANGTYSNYLALIQDGVAYVGMGCFTADVAGANGSTPADCVAEFSAVDTTHEAATAGYAVQQVAVATDKLEVSLAGIEPGEQLTVGDSAQLALQVGLRVASDAVCVQKTSSVFGVVDPSTSQTDDPSGTARTYEAIDISNLIAVEWASSNPDVASVDTSGLVSAVGSGTAAVSASRDGQQLASVEFVVQAAPTTIASVEQPAGVTTANGVAPELAATVHVTWSDGSQTDEAVAWDAIDPALYSDPAGGAFSAAGWVEGWGEQVVCQVTVEAAPATIASVEQPAGVTTANGVAPELAATAHVTWSDGSQTDEAVAWDAIDPALYSDPAGGAFSATGWVEGWGDPITCQVTVEAAPATISSVEQPAGVATANGVAPELPGTVRATWSDSTQTDEQIIWDAIDPALYSDPAGGYFSATGWVEGWGEQVVCQVTVEAAPATITAVEQPAGVETDNGVAPELPGTVRATWSDGNQTDEAVAWDAIDPSRYTVREGAVFSATGWVDGWADPVQCEIAVAAASASAQSVTVETTERIAPELPQTVLVTWSNGDEEQRSVIWDSVSGDQYAQAGSFTVNGTVALSDSYSVNVGCTVNVVAPTAVSVTSPAPISTMVGVAPALPQTARVTWSNGTQTDETVTWDAISSDSYGVAGSFIVRGAIEGTTLTVELTISVQNARVSSVETVNASTPAGVKPNLPAQVTATWEDGTTSTETVIWQTIDPASYAHQGATFEVYGTLALDQSVSVKAIVTVDAPVASAIVTPSPVTTTVGTAPVLPSTVTVTMSDGTSTSAQVAWDGIDPQRYSTAGRFVVSGTALDMKVNLTVIVSALTVSNVQNVTVATTVGVPPVLPSTVRVTWSDGSVTSESVSWDAYSSASLQTVGTFRVGGTAAGAKVSAVVTVNAAAGSNEPASTDPNTPQTITPTADENISSIAIGLTAAAGLAAFAGGITLAIRSLLRSKRAH